MRSLTQLFLVRLAALAVLSLPWACVHAAAKDGGRMLATILGGSTNDWRITGEEYKLVDEKGSPILVGGAYANGVVFTSVNRITADTEVVVRLRLGAAKGKATTSYFSACLKNIDDADQNPSSLVLTVPAAAEQEGVDCSLPPMPGAKDPFSNSYRVHNLPKEQTGWPAWLKARVEQDLLLAPPLAKRWLTVRCVVRKDAFQIYLDGRLLRDARGAGITPEGHVRLTIFEGTQLASLRIRKLEPENPLFETVALDRQLNASKLGREQIQRDSLPEAGKSITVGNVPFLIPSPDERNNDHIALNRSWMRFGALEGQFDGYEGETPRWYGTLFEEPGRIQFRVRNAPYSKLHLLAAFDGEPDTVPAMTAQFYRDMAGHPVNFSAEAPALTAAAGADALPVQLNGGGKGNLWRVTIPLGSEGVAAFSDQDHLEFELTKRIGIYRSYPDPVYYSEHGAGLPSGVHVYAMTLERPSVEVDFQPDRYAHIWTAPEKPSYTVTLRNRTAQKQSVKLTLSTTSHDGAEKPSVVKTVEVKAGGQEMVKMPLSLKRYGHHDVSLRVVDSQGVRTQTRALAHLHPDTRERGGWEEGRGPLFGFWDWGGGHLTPTGVPMMEVMVKAGAESSNKPLVEGSYTPEELAYAEKNRMTTRFLAYQLTMHKELLGVDFDPTKPAEMEQALIKGLKTSPHWSKPLTPTRTNKPEDAVMFGEPIVGPISWMSLPEYYGDPPYKMTKDEEKMFKQYLDEFLIMARAVKKTWPGARCLFPWGIPSFPIAYLRHSKEATELMDGPAVDLILFERIPEMQMHQVTFGSTMWQLKKEWLKTGKKWPNLITVEGVCASPAAPGALTHDQEADHTVRAALMLAAYGVTQHLGWPTPFRCAGSWGETHYGSGMCDPMPLLSPKVFYSAHATMTRQLNRMNYVKAIPTGSPTGFCLQFKHYKTGELLHVLWTVKGKRAVTLSGPGSITAFDSMDNEWSLMTRARGDYEIPISTAPVYVRGLKEDAKITLGDVDHSDSKPSSEVAKLSNLGDGTWKTSPARDNDYETAQPEFIKRFPAKMTLRDVEAPAVQGGKALSVHLEKPEKERQTMPHYTTLVPAKPIVIPGHASHLGLWVKASSDWGRVVYALKDAKGERWLSIGKKGEWNGDDMGCHSQFCFDGWRYLRFEMPGNQPYDLYRDMGTSNWGYFGKGDGIVDLPLTLEKIMVERRTHVIYLDDLLPASPDDVLLGDLFAEYESPADNGDEAVRLSRLRISGEGKGAKGSGGGGKKATDENPFH